MGMQSSPAPPKSPTPFGMSKTNIATGVKPTPFITPDQNTISPALSGYNMQPDQTPMVDPNAGPLGGAGSMRDQITALRGNMQRNSPFFGQMY